MNRNLREVRRYWPRARQSDQLLVNGAVLWTVYAADRRDRLRIVVCADGTATVGGCGVVLVREKLTIAEAMRAAGFEVLRGPSRFLNKWKRNDCAGVILPNCRIKPHAWFTPLADRQRPRKGARLGERKRTGWDKEETRHFAQWREWEGRP